MGLVTGVWVQCVSGNNYTFSNYSDSLKNLMGLTQLQLNNLSVAKDIGKAFGLLAGLASDRFPTSILLLIGSIEGLVGYGAQWLVVRQSILPLPYWQMCIFLCLGGNSTTWMNTAVLVTCIRNFRKNRGPVSGILKGYIGLSTAIFTDICSALFADDPASFLLMLAVVPAAVCTASMVFLREAPPAADEDADAEGESQYFGVVNAMAVVIAVYLLVFDISGAAGSGGLVSKGFVMVLLLLLAAPLAVPIYLWFKAAVGVKGVQGINEEPLLNPSVAVEEVEGGSMLENSGDGVKRQPALGEEHTIKEVLRTLDFWVLFVAFLCGVGTGMAVMNNMGQMGVAAGYTDVSIFVSLISIFGFFGRIGSGTLSEFFVKKAGTPRPFWNAASQILMAVGYIVMALALPGSLYIGSIIVGICYGVRLAVTVPTASELFGLKYYGLIYNILILNLPLGSFLFSGLLAGLLYDAQATKKTTGGNTCIGAHCYRLVFVIMSFACVIGFGLDVLLALRTRRLYMKLCSSNKSKKTMKAPRLL